jgi:hypothetical protein
MLHSKERRQSKKGNLRTRQRQWLICRSSTKGLSSDYSQGEKACKMSKISDSSWMNFLSRRKFMINSTKSSMPSKPCQPNKWLGSYSDSKKGGSLKPRRKKSLRWKAAWRKWDLTFNGTLVSCSSSCSSQKNNIKPTLLSWNLSMVEIWVRFIRAI